MNGRIVVDSSVVMAWCFEDESSQYADAVLDMLGEATVFVPSIWHAEVVNVLLAAERRDRITASGSARFLELLRQLPIVVEGGAIQERMRDLLALGRSTGLSAHDAAYLDMAMRKGCPLATLDQKLVKAAGSVSVDVFQVR